MISMRGREKTAHVIVQPEGYGPRDSEWGAVGIFRHEAELGRQDEVLS